MKTKHLARAALLLFVGGSLAYFTVKELSAPAVENHPAVASTLGNVNTAEVIVYYFSEGKDCSTCENIPAYAQEVLDTHFGDELASGKLAYVALDVEEKQHKHFVTEYGLYTKSIVLVAMNDGERGRWTNLEGIWDRVYDKPEFIEYVRASIEEFLDPSA